MTDLSKHIGLILFASVCIVSINAKNGFLRSVPMWLNRKKEDEGFVGDFFMRGSKNDDWRRIYSKNDEEFDEEMGFSKCELEIINDLDEVIVFCWVNHTGKLYHFYPINDRSIKDGSVSNAHVEMTHVSHAFVGLKQRSKRPTHLSNVNKEVRIVVNIVEKKPPTLFFGKDFIFLCKPTLGGVKQTVRLSKSGKRSGSGVEVTFKREILESANEVIDTSSKHYDITNVCGFTVNFEPGVFEMNPELKEALIQDLSEVCRLLPEAACGKLQASTPFWINQSITYGPKRKPIVATTCTFHPKGGEDWLCSMGMREDKAGGIELYSAKDFLHSRSLWGLGGLLLHELTHAYHNKHCPNGFDCEDVLEVSMAATTEHRFKIMTSFELVRRLILLQ